jgi:hypothetical protein
MLKEDNESLTLRVESFAHQLNDEVQQKAVLMVSDNGLSTQKLSLRQRILENSFHLTSV